MTWSPANVPPIICLHSRRASNMLSSALQPNFPLLTVFTRGSRQVKKHFQLILHWIKASNLRLCKSISPMCSSFSSGKIKSWLGSRDTSYCGCWLLAIPANSIFHQSWVPPNEATPNSPITITTTGSKVLSSRKFQTPRQIMSNSFAFLFQMWFLLIDIILCLFVVFHKLLSVQ